MSDTLDIIDQAELMAATAAARQDAMNEYLAVASTLATHARNYRDLMAHGTAAVQARAAVPCGAATELWGPESQHATVLNDLCRRIDTAASAIEQQRKDLERRIYDELQRMGDALSVAGLGIRYRCEANHNTWPPAIDAETRSTLIGLVRDRM